MINYKFSLILPTLNRPRFIVECLKSLINQTYKNFEVIIIDQSDDRLTEDIVDEFLNNYDIDIKYIKVKFKGLSKARNEGIAISDGQYICLLDDDARYNNNYLDVANEILKNNIANKVILSGKIVDDTINEEFVDYSYITNGEIFNDSRIFKVCLSAALIFERESIVNIGLFDERFGIGAYFGSAEETDLILRLVTKGFYIIHSSEMVIYHLKPQLRYDDISIMKDYKYALGGGALFKKHIVYLKNSKFIFRYIRSIYIPLIKMIINIFNKNEIKRNKAIMKGHIYGFWEYGENK